MIAVLVLVFGLIAFAASAFVVLPLLRSSKTAGPAPWLALAAGLGVAAVGLGAYAWLGQPGIALSSLTTPGPTDYPALVATLARQMPNRPDDIDGWMLLGRGYMAMNNPEQAAKALARAVAIAKEQRGAAPPSLLDEYGEALAEEAGQVTKDAEAVFNEAMKEDSKDLMSRYYVGLARSERGDKAGALELWKGVLADAPPDVPWRSALVNEVAALTAQSGGAAPNIAVMVAGLAARLEKDPNDINGWVMLIRAYSTLGDKEKATAALSRARTVFAKEPQAQAMLAELAQQYSLN